MTNTVIKPLGLKHTSFPTTPAMPQPFAHGYDTSFGPLKDLTFSNPAVPWAAGAMISTVPDMTIYARKLATGALLSKRLQAQRLRLGKLPNPGGARAGYGLGITGLGDWLGHDGAIFGYSDTVFFDPKEKATVVVMVNKAPTTLVAALPIFLTVASHLYPNSFPH